MSDIKQLIEQCKELADQAARIAFNIQRNNNVPAVVHSLGHRIISLAQIGTAARDFSNIVNTAVAALPKAIVT